MMIKLLALSAFLSSSASVDILRSRTIRIYKLGGSCEGRRPDPVVLKNVHVVFHKKINFVSMVVESREDVLEDLKLKLDVKRCKSRGALDSCEPYRSLTISRLCRLLNTKNLPWLALTESAEPPMKCPVKKGEYFVRNGTLDGSGLWFLSVTGWYWMVDIFVVGEKSNRVLLCAQYEGQMVSV